MIQGLPILWFIVWTMKGCHLPQFRLFKTRKMGNQNSENSLHSQNILQGFWPPPSSLIMSEQILYQLYLFSLMESPVKRICWRNAKRKQEYPDPFPVGKVSSSMNQYHLVCCFFFFLCQTFIKYIPTKWDAMWILSRNCALFKTISSVNLHIL